MPNNCCGKLTIIAFSNRIAEIKSRLRGTGDDEGNPFDFNKVIPMPEYIYRGSIGSKEQELYGKNNWYDWSIENWGTKWNSCDTEEWGCGFTFWTASSPCSPVIEELAKMFPDACFEYSYEESGLGFCGEERYEKGKLVYIMEAHMYEKSVEDEDDPITDYVDGRKEEMTVYIEDGDDYKLAKYKELSMLKSIGRSLMVCSVKVQIMICAESSMKNYIKRSPR